MKYNISYQMPKPDICLVPSGGNMAKRWGETWGDSMIFVDLERKAIPDIRCLPHDAVYGQIAFIEHYYPNFSGWYWDKVVPGLQCGSRNMQVVFEGGELLGVVISKKTEIERKLCTIWVREGARRMSLATTLCEGAFKWLGTRRPLLTVPEERICSLRPLISKLSFELTNVETEMYRKSRQEYVFNATT
ncbi:MAG: hypothetical protein ACFE0S_05560 [Rhodospirillales bacterium]